jgi:alkylated DNA nucleotide flippase Atl1
MPLRRRGRRGDGDTIVSLTLTTKLIRLYHGGTSYGEYNTLWCIRSLRRFRWDVVTTYGSIARVVPVPRGARGVGWALANNRDANIPWWRVVAAQGIYHVAGCHRCNMNCCVTRVYRMVNQRQVDMTMCFCRQRYGTIGHSWCSWSGAYSRRVHAPNHHIAAILPK